MRSTGTALLPGASNEEGRRRCNAHRLIAAPHTVATGPKVHGSVPAGTEAIGGGTALRARGPFRA